MSEDSSSKTQHRSSVAAFVSAVVVIGYYVTLVSRYGQACMQIASDPAVDGIVDIDLANNTLVELPYYLPAEG